MVLPLRKGDRYVGFWKLEGTRMCWDVGSGHINEEESNRFKVKLCCVMFTASFIKTEQIKENL